jgi:hypothetical protein
MTSRVWAKSSASATSTRDAHRLVDRQLMLALEACAQRLALDEGADEVARLAARAGVVERKDVRVLEPREESDLALESLCP